MFRKPKKIQRRVFCAGDDDDGDPEPPPPPIISQESLDKKEKRDRKENKPVKSVALLSFADEGKVFFCLWKWFSFVICKLIDLWSHPQL